MALTAPDQAEAQRCAQCGSVAPVGARFCPACGGSLAHPSQRPIAPAGGVYNVVLQVTVFLSGALLMALEILGSRVLAPAYGSSIFVWGSLITVVLGALALGSWLGGRAADAWPRPANLAAILALAGGLTWCIPAIAGPVVAAAGSDLRVGSLVAALGLFFAPMTFLGMISAYAIRLHGVREGRLGGTAGRFYALSTAGSMVGTLGTSFFLIPLTGVAALIRLIGLGLVLLAILNAAAGRGRRLGTGALVLLVGLGVGSAGQGESTTIRTADPALRTVYQRDSQYQHVRVQDDARARYLRIGNFVQSGIALGDPLTSHYDYVDYFHLAMLLRPEATHVAMVGLGGGIVANQFVRDYPGLRMDVAEIDPDIGHVARAYFGLTDDPRLTVHLKDGRQFLEASERRYDLIFLDAFSLEGVPFHLTTLEFFELCARRLAPGGKVVANLSGVVNGPERGLLPAYYATVGTVFPERYVFAEPYDDEPRTYGNAYVVAGHGPMLAADQWRALAEAGVARGFPRAYAAKVAKLVAWPGTAAPVLTDDYAPTELLAVGAS